MRPLLAFAATLLLVFFMSGCASGKLSPYPSDPPNVSRYSQYCLGLDDHFGFTQCETPHVVCWSMGQNISCEIKAPLPQPEAAKPSPTPDPPPKREAKKK